MAECTYIVKAKYSNQALLDMVDYAFKNRSYLDSDRGAVVI